MRNQIDAMFKEISQSNNITDAPLGNDKVQLDDKDEPKVKPQLENSVNLESHNITDEKGDCKPQQKENKKVSNSKENIWDEIPTKSVRSIDKKLQSGSKISFKITKETKTQESPKKSSQASRDDKQEAPPVVPAEAVKSRFELEETIAQSMKSKWDLDVSEDSFEVKIEPEKDLQDDSAKILEEELQDYSAKMLEVAKKRDRTDSRKSQEKMASTADDKAEAKDVRAESEIETNQRQAAKTKDAEAVEVTFKNGKEGTSKEDTSKEDTKRNENQELPTNERKGDKRSRREKGLDSPGDKHKVSGLLEDEDLKSGSAKKRERSKSPKKRESLESHKKRERSESPRKRDRSESPKKLRRKRSSSESSEKELKRKRDKKADKSSPARKKPSHSSSSIDDYSSTEMPTKQDELLEEVRRSNLSLISTLNAVSKSFIKSGLKEEDPPKPDTRDRSQDSDSDRDTKKKRKKGKKEKKKKRDTSSSSDDDDTSSDDDDNDDDDEKRKKSKKKKKRNDHKRSASR